MSVVVCAVTSLGDERTPVPFMPVLSRILSTRKPSPILSFVGRIIDVISIRKLSSTPWKAANETVRTML